MKASAKSRRKILAKKSLLRSIISANQNSFTKSQ
jgi:hypothetical protein